MYQLFSKYVGKQERKTKSEEISPCFQIKTGTSHKIEITKISKIIRITFSKFVLDLSSKNQTEQEKKIRFPNAPQQNKSPSVNVVAFVNGP